MKERETIDCGCCVSSDDVTGAISFALVAVTTMADPSAMSLFWVVSSAEAGVWANAGCARHKARVIALAPNRCARRAMFVVMFRSPRRYSMAGAARITL